MLIRCRAMDTALICVICQSRNMPGLAAACLYRNPSEPNILQHLRSPAA